MYRSCIKYNVSLQAEMDDGELFDYNSQEIGKIEYLIMYNVHSQTPYKKL